MCPRKTPSTASRTVPDGDAFRRGGPLLARCCLALLALLPLFGQVLRWCAPTTIAARGLTLLFSQQCHRFPERLLDPHLDLICSRCWGIYAGFAIAALLGRLTPSRRALGWCIAAGVLVAIAEAASEHLGLMGPHAVVRFLVGGCLSTCASSLMLHGLVSHPNGVPILESRSQDAK